jgi:hypothetical protein
VGAFAKIAACLLLLPSLGATTPDTPTLHFPQSGFSITPLDAPPAADHMVLTMYLPATGNFAPNVGVIVQSFPGSLDTYLANTKSQLDQMKWTLVKSQKTDDHTAIVEYTGKTPTQTLHWYQRILQQSGKIYLATATCTPEQWSAIGVQLRSSVDSIELDKK